MSSATQQQFLYTAIDGEIKCKNCMRDGDEYRYHNGRTHGTVVLCGTCVKVERLRNGRNTLQLK